MPEGSVWRVQTSVYVIDDPDGVCSVGVDGSAKTTLPPASINFACSGGKMDNVSTWLGVAGLMLMGILMSRSFKGSIITGEVMYAMVAACRAAEDHLSQWGIHLAWRRHSSRGSPSVFNQQASHMRMKSLCRVSLKYLGGEMYTFPRHPEASVA